MVALGLLQFFRGRTGFLQTNPHSNTRRAANIRPGSIRVSRNNRVIVREIVYPTVEIHMIVELVVCRDIQGQPAVRSFELAAGCPDTGLVNEIGIQVGRERAFLKTQ